MSSDGNPDIRMRQRILATVREFPGLHLREIARQLDTSVALVEYHVPMLEKAGVVRIDSDDRYVRLFAISSGPDLTPARRKQLAVLRHEWPLLIILRMLDVGAPLRHGELCDLLDMGKSKLSFHLKKLQGVGLVHKLDDGTFDLVQRTETADLLLSYQPTRDLRDRFSDLWANLYDA